jgi:hypothetical protein
MSIFSGTTKAQMMIEIVKRLRLRSPGPVLASRFSGLAQDYSARAGSKRLTGNVIRNQPAISLADQQRNRITSDETNPDLPGLPLNYQN